MCQKARRFDVNGFVKNLPDGTVEAVLEGEEEKVAELVNWAKKGTFLAKVKDIEIIKQEYKGEFKNFTIEY
jgi:acylphosphatase